mmetsp:Transcript_6957/g.6133  ORF Transcript_6957/g.6133 Transcript_6957/m.6133 type:complete len:119 (-) Transcript_6957:20-376(-)
MINNNEVKQNEEEIRLSNTNSSIKFINTRRKRQSLVTKKSKFMKLSNLNSLEVEGVKSNLHQFNNTAYTPINLNNTASPLSLTQLKSCFGGKSPKRTQPNLGVKIGIKIKINRKHKII